VSDEQPRAIVVGVSAGAVEALTKILPELPANFAQPMMIVVHQPPDKQSVLADVLQNKCRIAVKEAEDKEDIEPGHIYLAPPDYHLLVESDRRLSLSSEEQVHYSRPSIDVLFESAADVYGANLTGIILTGANSDGAAGLAAVVRCGGRALVQRPELAYASTMPRAALAACPIAQVVSLEELAGCLLEVSKSQ
jgi:two-component system chemotaxis response regulator CheB